MQGIYVAFVIVVILLIAVAFYLFQQLRKIQDKLEKVHGDYQTRISDMALEHQKEIDKARRQSVEQSRHTIKGQIAEQLAPLLPGFPYCPSDCRFIGDPVDYVIFKGYTEHKEHQPEVSEPLEIVVADIKHNQASLSKGQKEIANAIESGRVRFETLRISDDGRITTHSWNSRNNRKAASTVAVVSIKSELEIDDCNGSFDGQRATMLKILEKYPNAYKPWDDSDDRLLREKYSSGMKVKELSDLFQRRPSAIKARLKKTSFKP